MELVTKEVQEKNNYSQPFPHLLSHLQGCSLNFTAFLLQLEDTRCFMCCIKSGYYQLFSQAETARRRNVFIRCHRGPGDGYCSGNYHRIRIEYFL